MRWLLGLVLLAATPAWGQEYGGTLTGVAFEAGTGRPLAGVEIVVEGYGTVVTGDHGEFHEILRPGEYDLHIGDALVEDVRVARGLSTELLLTVATDGTVYVEREEPEGSAPQLTDPDAAPGLVRGRIVDSDEGTPVEGARVFVRGHGADARTDADGRFELELPTGAWQLSVLRSGFVTQQVPDVVVAPDGPTPLAIELVPAGMSLAKVTVRTPKIEGGAAELLEERRSSSAVADVLGAEDMARSGDSDAASALKRVTGLTVVGGRYVYVRGLGERYSSTLLNGSMLPSPEPERRVVPLDMFPVALLDSVVIQKTFTPDQPAEFGGGVVQLRTRQIPSEFVLGMGVSGGYNSLTTWKDGLSYQGGPTDWLGIDGGHRALPDAIAAASADEQLKESDMFSDGGYSAEELEALGELMPNVYNLEYREAPVNSGASFTLGNGWRFGDEGATGFLLGGTYGNSWENDSFTRRYFGISNDEVVERHAYDFESLTNTVNLGGIFTAGLKLDEDHELGFVSMISRNTDNEARQYRGYNSDVLTDIKVSRLRWIERQLATTQFFGSHSVPQLNGTTLGYRYSRSVADRIEPDRRTYRFDLEPAEDEFWLLSDRPEGNQRLFSDLHDVSTDIGVDLTVPLWGSAEQETLASFKIGGTRVNRDRVVDTRRYKFRHKGELSATKACAARIPSRSSCPRTSATTASSSKRPPARPTTTPPTSACARATRCSTAPSCVARGYSPACGSRSRCSASRPSSSSRPRTRSYPPRSTRPTCFPRSCSPRICPSRC